jgi:DNA-binding NtrC family response regulator
MRQMNNHCVMLVESDLVIRTPLAQYLRDCGFRVVEAFNPEEARIVLAQADITIDTVFLDADMPEESGFIFAAWMRANHPGVEVILAASVEKTVAKAGELCKEGTAISKPYDHKAVLDEIRRRIAARSRNQGES